MDRRSFLGLMAAAVPFSSRAFAAVPPARPQKLQAFDYRGVTLLDSRFKDQMTYARNLFFNLPNDDLLKGFRRNAGLPAPGKDMLGWCRTDCNATFGQWLSGMARLSLATGDNALREKAVYLAEEWAKTLGAGDDPRMATYGWEKMSCGLVDLATYGDYKPALDILRRITVWARDHFDRSRSPATIDDRDGRRPHGTLEWYTLAENSLRAYQLTGDPLYRDFAELWLYPDFWDPFLTTSRPANAALRHSYSHINTFSSVAMMYAVTGDQRYLTILKNGYDWARQTQTYASGGFGPGEWSVPADGALGDALDIRLDTAEIPCGSWAGFKLSRYLAEFTGEARYGDWIETLLYNGIGAALPLQPDGRAYYYADHRVGMSAKTYFWDEWPCCSGTYLQDIADYHNILYYHDAGGLYVNLTVPSTVVWSQGGQAVQLTQTTTYPEADTSRLRLELAKPQSFSVRLRIPSWCTKARILVNGQPVAVDTTPNGWADIKRTWQNGDEITLTLPMAPRLLPVDAQHPNRVAVLYGPVLMAQDARFSYPLHGPPDQVLQRLSRKPDALVLTYADDADHRLEQGGQEVGELRPFYSFGERQPYRSYFDLDKPRFL